MIRSCLVLSAVIAAFVTYTPHSYADGGTLQLRRETGPFVITVFTAPAPMTAGPIDLSVMVQSRENLAPLLDADVDVRLRSANGTEVAASATRVNAQNKLLYAAPLLLPASGNWTFEIDVKAGTARTTVSGDFHVESQPRPLSAYWGYIAFPAVMILIFAMRERLVRNRSALEVSAK